MEIIRIENLEHAFCIKLHFVCLCPEFVCECPITIIEIYWHMHIAHSRCANNRFTAKQEQWLLFWKGKNTMGNGDFYAFSISLYVTLSPATPLFQANRAGRQIHMQIVYFRSRTAINSCDWSLLHSTPDVWNTFWQMANTQYGEMICKWKTIVEWESRNMAKKESDGRFEVI